MIKRTLKALFAVHAICNNFPIATTSKIYSLALTVWCNLPGMLGEGKIGNEGIYIFEQCRILPKQRLRKTQ